MLRHMLIHSDFDNKRFLPQSAIKAADQILKWGDLARLKILLSQGKLGYQLQNLEFFRLMIRQWSGSNFHGRMWDVAFDITEQMVDTMIQEHWANDLMLMATEAGCVPITQRLIDTAQWRGELRAELQREVQFEHETSSAADLVH